jgi:hypothetical protein
MDFRDTHCIWCTMRKGSVEKCESCPKWRKYYCGEDLVLEDEVFCSVCINRQNNELSVYCTTNRRLQQDNDEPFECYKFCLDIKTGK